MFSADTLAVYGVGIRYWNVSDNPCDKLIISGAYLDINPFSNFLGVMGVGMGASMLGAGLITAPFRYLFYSDDSSKTIPTDSTRNRNQPPITSDVYINGLAISGIAIAPYNYNGVRINLLGPAKNGYGLSITGLIGIYENMKGLSVSGFYNSFKSMDGLSFSGIVNYSERGRWISISGIINESERFTGLQIAIFNKCTELEGIQIGLWNTNGKRSLPIINWQF